MSVWSGAAHLGVGNSSHFLSVKQNTDNNILCYDVISNLILRDFFNNVRFEFHLTALVWWVKKKIQKQSKTQSVVVAIAQHWLVTSANLQIPNTSIFCSISTGHSLSGLYSLTKLVHYCYYVTLDVKLKVNKS